MKSLVLKYDAERSKGKGKLTTYLVRVSHENMNFLCVYVYFCIYFGLMILRSRLSLKKNYLIKFKRRATLSTASVMIGKIIPSGKFTCIQHNCLK